jgi:DNA-binding transcriptional LysR family regulator
MDRLAIMKSFVYVAETSSFAGAAAGLGLSRALVSRHVAELEQQLGAPLLNRTTRAVTLTEAGSSHLVFCRQILAQFKEEEESVRGLRERPGGSLSVVSPKWIGSLDLGDAIAAFAAQYPMIKVKLELGSISERTHEFLSSGFDIAFQTRNLRDSSLMVRRIATLQFVLCAAPGYLQRAGRPTDPADLARHQCLLHLNDVTWQFVHAEETVSVKPADVSFESNTFLVLQKAAVQGMGIALLPLRSVQREIAAGELVPLLPAFRIPDRPLYAIYAPGGYRVRRIQCFLDFIAQWYQAHPVQEGLPRKA